ncbi:MULTISPECIES: family 1 encapsulin nanocompartment shell protein [Gordonibacter]|uniref:Type 1 encapsulin shell protein n=1 Tax=Gordonibacter faecis TaxID=3047475 RepID=A0ABT7DPF9_9ACTN|nr:family 1 encapsulin nanocompartment shell protein [Gordonibacter sp. KGMB12511]MDJ1651434.1 family 1 encapsulin nanocompartment shell protein [Gordonibacter sp. KGMB12511]HIW76026.1 bacteriocin family protein [Candidatus Gordonibacter avicola]
MDYLARESADLSVELWNRIDDAVIGTARAHLTCRRFLKTYGPLGPGITTVAVDGVAKDEVLEDGIGRIVGRTQLELPLFYEDFTLFGRDLDLAARTGTPVDMAPAIAAAKKATRREDDLILNGNKALGTDGLLTVKGSVKVKKGDWKVGENAFTDVAAAVSQLAKNGYLGRYALVVAPDLFLDLQRLQPNTGMLEIDRIQKLVQDVYMTSVLDPGKAVLVCAEPEYLDVALGLDLSVGYLELVDFNHTFRIMETPALRIKDPAAIAVLA